MVLNVYAGIKVDIRLKIKYEDDMYVLAECNKASQVFVMDERVDRVYLWI